MEASIHKAVIGGVHRKIHICHPSFRFTSLLRNYLAPIQPCIDNPPILVAQVHAISLPPCIVINTGKLVPNGHLHQATQGQGSVIALVEEIGPLNHPIETNTRTRKPSSVVAETLYQPKAVTRPRRRLPRGEDQSREYTRLARGLRFLLITSVSKYAVACVGASILNKCF